MTFKTLMMSTTLVSVLAIPAFAEQTQTDTSNTAAPAVQADETLAQGDAASTTTQSDEYATDADAAAPSQQSDEQLADSDPATTADDMEPTTVAEFTVDEFIGLSVQNIDGDDIGEIDYVISAGGTSSETRAVIGIGGFLGLGEYTVALPLSDFSYDTEKEVLMVSQTEDALRATPEIDESNLESIDGDTLLSEVMAPMDLGIENPEGIQGEASDIVTN